VWKPASLGFAVTVQSQRLHAVAELPPMPLLNATGPALLLQKTHNAKTLFVDEKCECHLGKH
jgi:hypothetical protein